MLTFSRRAARKTHANSSSGRSQRMLVAPKDKTRACMDRHCTSVCSSVGTGEAEEGRERGAKTAGVYHWLLLREEGCRGGDKGVHNRRKRNKEFKCALQLKVV
ncbi:hypothetical protein CHARACLAT_007548 [Characodon lateralis]|uniref:Uncharacterized protein n=1 Tax=Characodon lateralis TaxID=208331 RepID=A0ABU7EHT0_9TELE|nr:hypothetical protein [Characodon lateralis]